MVLLLHLRGVLFFNFICFSKITVLSDMTPCRLISQQIQMLLCPVKLVSVHHNARRRVPENLLTSEPQILETDILREYLSNE
jgi:hypothetical protein